MSSSLSQQAKRSMERREQSIARHRCLELLFSDEFLLDKHLAHPHAPSDRLLEDLGGFGVSDARSQRRHDRGRLLQVVPGLVGVRRDSIDALTPNDREEMDQK